MWNKFLIGVASKLATALGSLLFDWLTDIIDEKVTQIKVKDIIMAENKEGDELDEQEQDMEAAGNLNDMFPN